MGKFLERHKLPKEIQEEKEIKNRTIGVTKEIELGILHFSTMKSSGPDGFTEFYQMFTEDY
jgi:hypothetical protein